MSGADNLRHELRQGGGLFIQVLGRDLLENTEPTIRAIAALLKAHRATAALIDLRDVPGDVSFMERYALGEHAGRHLPRIPVAVLMHERMADPQRIGTTVARNRGASVEAFTDPALAEGWFAQYTNRV